MKKMISAGIVVVVASLGCALTSETVRPDDRSGHGHMQEARKHKSSASEHRSRYDPAARMDSDTMELDQVRYTPEVYNPTLWHRHEADRQDNLAAQHEAAAGELEAFEEKECGLFPPDTRKMCPLLGSVKSVEPIENGARFHLREGVNVEAVVDHARCHVAFGREQGRDGMPGCPLYVKGVRVAVSADGKSLDITSDSPLSVKEIQSRAAVHAKGCGCDD